MRLALNIFKAATAASCLALAACGGDSSADSQSPATPDAVSMSVLKTSVQGTASLSGTIIPSAPQIIDSSGNVWTVSRGVIYMNGALAGYSNAVTQLLYDNKIIYQENAAGGWWSWIGSGWVASSDPRKVASANGANIPASTQITDASGNVWTVSGGIIYKNGAAAGYSNAVTQLVYDNGIIYQENSAGGWWSWSGGTWTSSNDPVSNASTLAISGSPSPSDAAGVAYSFVPATTSSGGTLTFSVTNLPSWASFSTATGAITGTPSNVQAGTYSNILVSVSNGSASASLAAFSINVTAAVSTSGAADLSWTPPTQNTDGTPLTDLAGYTIYYGTDQAALTKTIQVASPSETNYVVGNLTPGTYYFAVAAYTSDGAHSSRSLVGSKTIS
jgi:hypothetical protein